jgi:hypothetical protein
MLTKSMLFINASKIANIHPVILSTKKKCENAYILEPTGLMETRRVATYRTRIFINTDIFARNYYYCAVQ